MQVKQVPGPGGGPEGVRRGQTVGGGTRRECGAKDKRGHRGTLEGEGSTRGGDARQGWRNTPPPVFIVFGRPTPFTLFELVPTAGRSVRRKPLVAMIATEPLNGYDANSSASGDAQA
eukprot:793011-Prorocentrum_minimum.AAC.2